MVSQVVPPDELLRTCVGLADRIDALSRIGIELTKKMLWAGLEAGSYRSHINHEMNAQLFVRMTTENFEEAIRARAEGRAAVFLD